MLTTAVVVPAHDEETLLPDCLAALRVAAASVTPGHVVRITVVADACTDRTAEAARAAGVRVLEVGHRNVGAARAAGFATAIDDHARRGTGELWLASTDADSRVPPSWLADHARYRHDYDVVAGEVEVDDWSGWPDWLPAVYRQRYDVERRHVHGANLSFSAAAYLRAQGFASLACHEDQHLVTSLRGTGARILYLPENPVRTSARADARCTGGFGSHLAALAERVSGP